MLIYQPSLSHSDHAQLRQISSFLVQKLFPNAKILSAPNGAEPICQLLRSGPLLIEIQFYGCELGEGVFETLLRTAAALEVKRKEQQDPALLDIGVCVLAQGFSREFLARLPSSLVRVDIFEWECIRSEEDKAILIRPIRSGILPERGKNTVENLQTPDLFPIESKASPLPHHAPPELSTPELIAFARLGMELRSRKAQSGLLSSK